MRLGKRQCGKGWKSRRAESRFGGSNLGLPSGVRNRKLEVESTVDGEQAENYGEQHCADDGDEDAADHSMFADAAEAEIAGDVAAEQGAHQTDKHVDEDAVAGALHDFAGDPSGDDTDEEPGEQAVAECVIQGMIHSF